MADVIVRSPSLASTNSKTFAEFEINQ